MTGSSDLMLYVVIGFPLFFVAIFLVAMGPAGWFLLVFLGIAVLATQSWVHDDGATGALSGTNCRECGARNAAEANACDYCGATIAGD